VTRTTPSLLYERAFWRDGFCYVAGLDEVGRGALAGPVVAAAVILPRLEETEEDWTQHTLFQAIARANDSKLLNEKTREALFDPICSIATAFSIGSASVQEIDKLNILQASLLAMHRALEVLPIQPDALLLDALVLHSLHLPQQGLIHGDSLALSIAAASIVAKVTRDRIMRELDAEFPQFGLARNKGYGTRTHLKALYEFGASPIHRQSFAPVRQAQMGDFSSADMVSEVVE
jgi:ribonuclease HII